MSFCIDFENWSNLFTSWYTSDHNYRRLCSANIIQKYRCIIMSQNVNICTTNIRPTTMAVKSQIMRNI